MAVKELTVAGAFEDASTATPASSTHSLSTQVRVPTGGSNQPSDDFSRLCPGRHSLQPCRDLPRTDQELKAEYEFTRKHTATNAITHYLLPVQFVRAWRAHIMGNSTRPPPFDSTSLDNRDLREMLEKGDAIGVSLMQYIAFRRTYGGCGLVRVLNYTMFEGAMARAFEAPHVCCGSSCRGGAVGCWTCEARKMAYEAVMLRKRAQGSRIPEEYKDEIDDVQLFIAAELAEQNTFLGYLASNQLGQLQSLASCLDHPLQCLEENASEQLRSMISRRHHDFLQLLKAPTPHGPHSEMSQLIGAAQKALHVRSAENMRSLAIAQQETSAILKRLTASTPLAASPVPKARKLLDLVTLDDVMLI